MQLEEGVEGLVHVSQISSERIDKPSQHFEVGEELEAEVTNIDPREKKIGLSVRALRRSEERAEMDAYLSREGDKARFSLEDVMSAELQKRVGGGDSETES